VLTRFVVPQGVHVQITNVIPHVSGHRSHFFLSVLRVSDRKATVVSLEQGQGDGDGRPLHEVAVGCPPIPPDPGSSILGILAAPAPPSRDDTAVTTVV
jgi:hypothetical protein